MDFAGARYWRSAMVHRSYEHSPAQWQANLILGLWPAISPWIFPYLAQGVAWNARLTDLAIVGVAAPALVAYDLWNRWLNEILAIWSSGPAARDDPAPPHELTLRRVNGSTAVISVSGRPIEWRTTRTMIGSESTG
jgi:hypothetical protein